MQKFNILSFLFKEIAEVNDKESYGWIVGVSAAIAFAVLLVVVLFYICVCSREPVLRPPQQFFRKYRSKNYKMYET